MTHPPDFHDPWFLQGAALAGAIGKWDWALVGERFEVSQSLEAFLPVPLSTFLGTRDAFLELVHPLDRGRLAAALEAAHQGSDRTRIEFRVTDAKGNLRWFRMRAEIAATEPGERPHLAGTMEEVAPPDATEPLARP